MVNRRSDDTFRGARNLQFNRAVRDSLGQRDRIDFYKFRASGQANFTLALQGLQANASVRLLNSKRAPIAASNQPGNRAEQITATLDRGLYYIQVQFLGRRGTTQYNLRTSATPTLGNSSPDPGNTLPTARNLGVFSGNLSAKEYVGPVDPADIYRFTLNDLSKLQITRTGPSRDPKVQLVRDNNNNGLIDSGEIFVNDNQFAILSDSATVDLPVGTYFILVEPGINSSFPTFYQMDLAVTPYGGNGLPDPGNSLPTARDLGNLSGTTSFKEYVGPLLDPNDIYRFTLNDLSKLQITRTGPSRDPKVKLVRDNNNNGLIDSGEIFVNDNQFAILSDSGTVDLPIGTYFILVEPGGIFTSLPTVYQMDLVVTPYGGNGLPDPGNSLPTARNLGNLSGTTSFKEYVGNTLDPNDFYRFIVGSPTNLQARLTTSDGDLNLNLIQDTNNNGLIDTNEILSSGVNSLTRVVPAGTYFLRVEPRFFGGNRSANYELTLVTT